MSLEKGDLVVHRDGGALTGRMLFYVEGYEYGGTSGISLSQVSSKIGWGLGLPEAELEVVGHTDHQFKRHGYAFYADEMHHFQDALAEVRRRGYDLVPGWTS